MPDNQRWKTTNDEFRGYSKAKFEEIHSDVKEIKDTLKNFGNSCVEKHVLLDGAVAELKEAEVARKAVQKRMHIVTAFIVTIVTAAANFAWKIVR